MKGVGGGEGGGGQIDPPQEEKLPSKSSALLGLIPTPLCNSCPISIEIVPLQTNCPTL